MPPEYTSAESNIVSPASRQMSTSRVASATSLAPQDLKNSLPPPNVPVPRLNAGTLNPEPPSCLYSIEHSSVGLEVANNLRGRRGPAPAISSAAAIGRRFESRIVVQSATHERPEV